MMALVSITRDTGDFGEALRHAREFVALDLRTRDYARWFLISKSVCPTGRHANCRPSERTELRA
jgi:hypothetical protein